MKAKPKIETAWSIHRHPDTMRRLSFANTNRVAAERELDSARSHDYGQIDESRRHRAWIGTIMSARRKFASVVEQLDKLIAAELDEKGSDR